jgi:hypothetical protein
LYGLSNSRTERVFSGLALERSGFCKSAISPDGALACCGTEYTNGRSNRGYYPSQLKFWKTISGESINCRLSSEIFPFPVRSVSWHPTEHMIAIAIQGDDASIYIYVAENSITRSTSEAEIKFPLVDSFLNSDEVVAEQRVVYDKETINEMSNQSGSKELESRGKIQAEKVRFIIQNLKEKKRLRKSKAP